MVRVKIAHNSVKEPLALKWQQWNHQVNNIINMFQREYIFCSLYILVAWIREGEDWEMYANDIFSTSCERINFRNSGVSGKIRKLRHMSPALHNSEHICGEVDDFCEILSCSNSQWFLQSTQILENGRILDLPWIRPFICNILQFFNISKRCTKGECSLYYVYSL